MKTDTGGPLPPNTPPWIRHTTTVLVWAYLMAMEAALWVVRGAGDDVLSVGGIFFGMAILGYLLTRLFLHFSIARRSVASTAALLLPFGWLLLRLAVL